MSKSASGSALLSRRNAAAAAALALGGAASGRMSAQVKPAGAGRFEPRRHDKDDWLDQVPGQHRLVFDTTTPESLSQALLFANNFLRTNRTDYGLQNSDLAVVIVVRHRSAPFGFNDAMWAKYGAAAGAHASFEDPKTKTTPKINVFNATDYGTLLANRGVNFEMLAKQGVQIAVCSASTRAISGVAAKAMGVEVDTVFKEITSNLVSNARMAPAGIVTVARAQERGYALISNCAV
jgi:intracellular sulfur oxidation DsrE/DsrF family protein